MVSAEFNRLSFNLQRGTGEEADIFLHLDARPASAMVVRNARLSGDWGAEETEGALPFAPSTPFLLVVSVFSDVYEIEIDGKPFTRFAHRDGLPLTNVTHMSITGDVILSAIHIPVENMPKNLRLGIPGKTKIGDLFTFSGTVLEDADRFIINLQCGPGQADDVVFQFNPRMDEQQVIRNTRLDDTWDSTEERHGGFPFAQGQKFNLDIGVTSSEYVTWVNGVEFIRFAHRLDMTNACTLYLAGDVQMHNIRINSIASRLPPQSGDHSAKNFQNSQLQVFYPPTPVALPIAGGLAPGKIVAISGVVNAEPNRFSINLQSDPTDGTDIMYHFNPRFGGETDIRMNSRESGTFGEELQVFDSVLLLPGVAFELQIACMPDGGFFTAVNGCPLYTFPGRMDLTRADHVGIEGDVTVRRIVVL